MPSFYLDLFDGQQIEPDQEGVELEGLEEAFELAVQIAGAMLAARPRHVDRSGWAFHVRNERAVLFTLNFAVAAPDPYDNRRFKRKGRPKAAG